MAQTTEFRESLEYFHATSLQGLRSDVLTVPDSAWTSTWTEQAASTPAYVEFLRENGFSVHDLLAQRPPVTTKPNYIAEYPISERCVNARLSAADFLSVSSGTTGQAMIWPRSSGDEIRTAFVFEQIFRNSFQAHRQNTLALICFPLGIWVGGMYSTSALRMVASKHYPITVLTPGTNMAEIRRCLVEFAPLFDQTVICGYPPFIREVVDNLVPSVLDPEAVRIRLVLAGEAISESWRDHMAAKLKFDNVLNDCISIYGTADAGVIGFETESTIALRRLLTQDPTRRSREFGSSGIPSLFEYQPFRMRVEEDTESILLTVLGVHPLFRYSLGDRGSALSGERKDDLPTIVLHGRADHTVSFFGGNVYPEHVSSLLDRTEYQDSITGRFTLLVAHTTDGNCPLSVVVELQPLVQATEKLQNTLAEALEAHLQSVNSEYANYVPSKYRRPNIICKPHQDVEFFARGKKQVYVQRTQT